jgi:hypothetical protein
MQSFDAIAERRIREAQDRGDFDNLPGSGAPLALDDDRLVPEDLRVAYRLLKNAGFIPPELAPHREIRDLEQLLQAADTDGERRQLLARLNCLLTRTSAGRRRGQLQVEADYYGRIAARLSRG